jgi:MoaA/NifB/PqqE/SkfB family radical SAM enzyme
MEWEVFETLSRYFQDAEEVDFTGGGEPLLHPRLEEMIRRAKAASCVVGFSTNATLLSFNKASALLETGVDWVAYSVEGATAETYEKIRVGASFTKIIENIKGVQRLKEEKESRKPKTMLFFVMMKENIHELPAMIEMAQALGIEHVVAKNLDVILKEGDDERRIFKHKGEGEIDLHVSQAVEEAKRKAEGFKMPFKVYELLPTEKPVCEQDPLDTLFVSWDGFVSPCINFSYTQARCFGGRWQSSPIIRFGNIAHETLDAIWEKREYQNFRQLFLERAKGYSRDLVEFLTPDFHEFRKVGNWPSPPHGCEVCYYLYGV